MHTQESSIGRDTVGEGREALGVDAVFLNQVPHNFIKDGGPDGSRLVNNWLSNSVVGVNPFVGERVGSQAGGVEVGSDASRSEADPGTHGLVGCARLTNLEVNGNRHEISPSFTHTTRLIYGQAVGVCWTTSEAIRYTVSVFVNDNTSIETAVAVGNLVVPDEHGHSAGLAIDRGCKVCVVESLSILCVEDNSIASFTSLAIVVGLKISSRLIESKFVKEIMVNV